MPARSRQQASENASRDSPKRLPPPRRRPTGSHPLWIRLALGLALAAAGDDKAAVELARTAAVAAQMAARPCGRWQSRRFARWACGRGVAPSRRAADEARAGGGEAGRQRRDQPRDRQDALSIAEDGRASRLERV